MVSKRNMLGGVDASGKRVVGMDGKSSVRGCGVG